MKNLFGVKILPLILAITISIASFGQVNTTLLGGSYPTGSPMMGVAYGNGAYVAIGYYGNIVRSTDGTNWVTVKTSTFLNVTYGKLAFGNGMFVGISNTGDIVTSPDGLTWTIRSSGTTNYLSDVAYVNGRWVIVGSSATALTSTDNGTTWSSFSVGAGSLDGFNSILYVGGKYYIGCRDNTTGTSRLYSSATGPGGSWTSAVITVGGSLNKVCYLNNRWFAFNSTPSVYTSTDGISWSIHPSSRLAAPNQIFNAFYDGTTYYLTGSSQEFSYLAVFTSTDGLNFTLQPQTTSIVTQVSAYLNGKYFIGGNEGLVSSATGTSWSFVSSSMNGIATDGSVYVGVGQNTSNEAAIQVSNNYTSWSPIIFGVVKPLNGVCYGGGRFVAVGNVNGTSSTYATSITGGLTWVAGNTGTNDALRAVAYGNYGGGDVYIAVGLNGRILKSTNGTNWVSKDVGTGYHFYGVSYIGGKFIAVGGGTTAGSAAKVKYSSDGGETWTDVGLTMQAQFHAVVYGNGQFTLVGRDNVTGSLKFNSVITTDITNAASYGTSNGATTPEGDIGTLGFGGLSYNNATFTAIANLKVAPFSAYVMTSTNGTSWTATPVNSTTRLRAIVAVGTGFRALGATPGAFVSISIGATLPLHLTEFTGRESNGGALLNWKTTNEENTSRFEIERSEDGRSFTKIGTVTAKNIAGTNIYQYTDVEVKSGVRYYRLKMIDRDAKSTYSQVVRIGSDKVEMISVYPNPASDYFTLTLPSAIPARISVFNNRGEKIFQKQVEGTNIPVSISTLTRGTYVVQVVQGEKTYTEKIVKQ